jgi:glutaryl-CoA dehydrogenase (non-decarboxylating)
MNAAPQAAPNAGLPAVAHLTAEQAGRRAVYAAFADEHLVPHADRVDAEQSLPGGVMAALAGRGYLGAMLPEVGGLSWVEYGLLTEELGRACQTVRNFVAVQDMVIHSLARWGTAAQRGRWLGPLCAGQARAAFALTEPDVGSDAAGVRTTATRDGDAVVLDGVKTWISFAQVAEVFLLFASLDGAHTAFLVQRDTPGLAVEPITGLLGLRGSQLGRVTLDSCRMPATAMVAGPGLGLTFVAAAALDLARYSTAYGAVGLAEACLRACAAHAGSREQYGVPIRDHQLVARMLADLVTDTTAARLLCHHAGLSKDQNAVEAVNHTLMAKYRASTIAVRAASDAVQMHGAQGIGGAGGTARHYRDAKVLEIIEGTTEMQQSMLGAYAARVGRQGAR